MLNHNLNTEQGFTEIEERLIGSGVRQEFIDAMLPALRAVLASGESPHMCAVQCVTLASAIEFTTQTPDQFERYADYLREAAAGIDRVMNG